jgi:ABC-2 type transport system ATP-binding protein
MALSTPDGLALRADRLAKAYGARLALRDVSLDLAHGELVAIVGPNGAGKTTLLQILAGALTPTSGRVAIRPPRIGWVPQQPALYLKLTVAENLALFARLEKVPDPDAAVRRMLEQTGLQDRARDQVSTLSGGNVQRVNIAIGLLSDPPVLLLDEPSSALDARQREVLWSFVGSLARAGTTVLYSTHDLGEVARHADRILVLADGEVLFSGVPRALARDADEALDEAFLRFLGDRGH